MSTYVAFYVRKQAPDETTRAAILSLYPASRLELLPNHIGAILSGDDADPPEQKFSELSARFDTDVVWVTYQTTAGSFMFHHWQSGRHLRGLWYGCKEEATWDRVEGRPEPWEAEAFWSQEALESSLQFAEDDSQREKFNKLWNEKIIHPGQSEPMISAQDSVFAAMQHYGLFPPDESPTPHAHPGPRQNAPQKPSGKPSKNGCMGVLFVIAAASVAAVFMLFK